MKKIKIILISIVVLTILAALQASNYSFSQSINATPARIGVQGLFGFVITEVDVSTPQSELKLGDIIITTSLGGQLTNIESFQDNIRNAPDNSVIKANCLRFNSQTNSFDEITLTLKTFPSPSRTFSRLGVNGVPGYLITEIDSRTNQPDLAVNDIITYTSAGGEIVDIERFQEEIKKIKVGSMIRAARLRFNPVKAGFEETSVVLKTYPFPSPTFIQKVSFSTKSQCKLACGVCCEYCSGGSCRTSDCETGKRNCRSDPGGCRFEYCA